MRKPTLIAASLAFAASACNNAPGPLTASFPPVIDLTCQAEPQALSIAAIEADGVSEGQGAGRPNEQTFNDAALLAGRSCRDALHRVCMWHLQRGAKVDCEAETP